MSGHGKDKDRRNSRQADFADEREYAGMSSSHQVKQASTLHAEDLVSKFSGQDKTYSIVRWAQDIEDNSENFQSDRSRAVKTSKLLCEKNFRIQLIVKLFMR